MSLSSRTGNLIFDPEVEKTTKRLRKETQELRRGVSEPLSEEELDSIPSETIQEQPPVDDMADAECTLREMGAPTVNQQPLCITVPNIAVNFKLKSGFIHLLPTFHGFSGEDPHKHLKDFHVVCSSMKPEGVTEEQIKLLAFPFSLTDKAKDWLYYLPSGSITTWNNLQKSFLEKFFLANRATSIRKEICGIRKFQGE